MKLIIDIPDRLYEEMLKNKGTDKSLDFDEGLILEVAAENGTPLPKGHGELIDRKALLNRPYEKGGFVEWYDEIKHAPTIIEADKENKE